MDALTGAGESTRKVVFFGLGFETTMPTPLLTLQQAKARDGAEFLLLLPAHYAYPGVAAVCWSSRITVSMRFSGAGGHVSMVIGTDANFYRQRFSSSAGSLLNSGT